MDNDGGNKPVHRTSYMVLCTKYLGQKCWKGDKHGIWWSKRVLLGQLIYYYYYNLMFKTNVVLSHDLIRPCLRVVSI